MRTFSFNGTTIENVRVLGYSKLLASSREVVINGEGPKSRISRVNKQSVSEIHITVGVAARTKSELHAIKRKIIGQLASDEPGILWVSEDPNIFYKAILQGKLETQKFDSLGRTNLVFLTKDGIAYSVEVFQNLSSGTNNGTLPAKPILSFTADGPTRQIVGNVTLSFEGLTIGDKVEIDTETGIVTVNGANGNHFEAINSQSDKFEIPVGPWSITGATATFRERYI